MHLIKRKPRLKIRIESIFRIILYIFWALSIISIIFSLIEATTQYSFELSDKGFKKLFSIFLQYGPIFYSTIILTTAFYTIRSFVEKSKKSKKDLWYNIFKETLDELRKENGVIYRTCLLEIEEIFNSHVTINGKFDDEQQLVRVLEKFVKPWIDKFEMGSVDYKAFKGVYPNDLHSFSERTYFEILLHIGKPSNNFKNMFIDCFEKKYREILKQSYFGASRNINATKFKEIQDDPPIKFI